jgi:dienelactone hydrolase
MTSQERLHGKEVAEMFKKYLLLVCLSLCFLSPLFAETIVLKSGKTVEGKIVEKNENYTKVDFNGIILKYSAEEIAEIKTEPAQEKQAAISSKTVKKGDSTYYLEYGNEKVRLDIYNPGLEKCPVVILIHGAAGIEGDRAVRYRDFATDLMNSGIIAINVHYFQSQKSNWKKTFIKTIDYAERMANADKDKIGLVGYSLGGTVALGVAAADNRVKLLALCAGFLPQEFTKADASRLPKTLMISGSQDRAMNTLNTLSAWFKELGKPCETKIDQGIGHDNIPMNVFHEDWNTIMIFFTNNFGLAKWQSKTMKIRVE